MHDAEAKIPTFGPFPGSNILCSSEWKGTHLHLNFFCHPVWMQIFHGKWILAEPHQAGGTRISPLVEERNFWDKSIKPRERVKQVVDIWWWRRCFFYWTTKSQPKLKVISSSISFLVVGNGPLFAQHVYGHQLTEFWLCYRQIMAWNWQVLYQSLLANNLRGWDNPCYTTDVLLFLVSIWISILMHAGPPQIVL